MNQKFGGDLSLTEKKMAEFAYVIMILFEMQASHLFRLKQNNKVGMLKKLSKKFTDQELVTFVKKCIL